MKTLHFDIRNMYPGYVMFNFFSFTDGQLNVGQSQSCKIEESAAWRRHLISHGWTEASWKYVDGKAVLVS